MSNYQLFQNDLPLQSLKSFKGDIAIDTETLGLNIKRDRLCLLYTSPSPRDYAASRMPSSA